MVLILEEEKLTEAKRAIFTCKRCKRLGRKHIWAREYTHRRYDSLYREADGQQIWHTEEYECPNCKSNAWVTSNVVVGHASEQKCNAKCWNATGPNCDCQCAGGQHGQAHM